MEYRTAVKADIDFLVQSRLNFIEVDPAHEGYGFMQKSCRHYLQESFDNQTCEAVLAEEGGVIVGLGVIFYYRSVPSLLNPTGFNGYITNLFVEEAFRRRGIGRELAKRLINKAAGRNCYIITLHASELGKPLYQSLGFHAIANSMIFNNWEAAVRP